jgi:hypothetical protein
LSSFKELEKYFNAEGRASGSLQPFKNFVFGKFSRIENISTQNEKLRGLGNHSITFVIG